MGTIESSVGTVPAPDWRDHELAGALAAPPHRARTQTSADLPAAMRTRMRRDAIYRRLLAISDIVALIAALVLGGIVSGASATPFVLLSLPALIITAKVLGLYDRDQHLIHKATLDELPKLFHLAVLVSFALVLSQGLLFEHQLSADAMLVLAICLFVGMATGRALARGIARALAPVERCVVIGDRNVADEVAASVRTSGATVEFVGLVGEKPTNGSTDDLAAFLLEYEIHRVIVAPGAERERNLLGLVAELKTLGIRISVLPSVSQAGGGSFEFDRLDGLTLLGVRGFEFNRSSQLLKRAMDLLLASATLIFSLPLMVAIAIAIVVDSRGGVLYRQTRVGRHGHPFAMLKFRTMHADAEERRSELEHMNEAGGGIFKIAADPRVTRVGRWLRAASLDELPQLWNVIRGDMSLVGPRPLVESEDRLIAGWHRQRLSLRPGMTGYWQVLGSARIPLDEMVKLDYSYVQNWSAWHDLQLLLRTIPFVARRRGL